MFAYTGWEGSATDARVYESALLEGLDIPEGKYYLADAGFPSCKELLIPYRSTRYHLAEWGRAGSRYIFCNLFVWETCIYINNRPTNKEELFNLRHSSARNVIERIFGVLKRRFRILLLAPEYNLDIQARIPAALCAIHNFIGIHNPDEELIHAGDENDENGDDNAPFDNHGAQAAGAGFDGPSVRRDNIAQAMWDDYLAVRLERGIDSDDESETESDDDDE